MKAVPESDDDHYDTLVRNFKTMMRDRRAVCAERGQHIDGRWERGLVDGMRLRCAVCNAIMRTESDGDEARR